MKPTKLVVSLLLGVSLPGTACSPEGAEDVVEQRSHALTATELAFRWAPIIHQDVDKNTGHGNNGINGKSDYLAKFDYDDDLVLTNNWERLRDAPIKPVVYFAVTESTDRFYIYYLLYHPRDWVSVCSFDNEHENDAEGYMFIIKKDGTPFGTLEGGVSQVHGGLESYSNVGYLTNPNGGMFTMQFEQLPNESFSRVRGYVEPQGHASHLCGSRVTNCFRSGDDGIRYVPDPAVQDEVVHPVPNGTLVTARYTLVDMTALSESALFSLRFDPNVLVNARLLRGDNSDQCGGCVFPGQTRCSVNGATAIWAWSERAFGQDPAAFARNHYSFGGEPVPNSSYLSNTFSYEQISCRQCAHDTCNVGTALSPSCNSCVQMVCAADAFCCNNSWDGVCVHKARTICNHACNCAHSECTVGAALSPACSITAREICEEDPFCCQNSWDSICVGRVSSTCGRSCN